MTGSVIQVANEFEGAILDRMTLDSGGFCIPRLIYTAFGQAVQVIQPPVGKDRVHFWGEVGAFRVRPGNSKAILFGAAVIGNDTLPAAAHPWVTGDLVRVSTAGAIPTPLVALTTDYYVIVVDANNIKLATTYDNAVNGIAIDITVAGNTSSVGVPIVAIPAAAITDGYGSVKINAGDRVTCKAAKFYTVFGIGAADSMTYFFT